MVKGFSFAKKIVAMVLCICVICSVIGIIPVSAQETDGVAPVSQIVQGENGAYIEYLGKPYLMYGMQMRVDWAYEDKKGDEEFIAENFKRVVEDGFTSVAIPIYWSTIEPTKDNYTFARLELYYKYLNMYDLTVQWLWFGSNVCGGAGLVPSYIKQDTETYWNVEPNIGNGHYIDYSCTATLEREKLALGKMMKWLAVNDTAKRCVMIQVNNEVDQAGNYFDPGYSFNEAGETVGNGTATDYWYNNPDKHDAYCWAGGQREECFAYLSALGDVIHQSDYSVVTRVNVSGAGRNMPEIEDDLTEILATTGIDIVGEDIYYKTWEDVEKYNSIIDGNVSHLAENGANYDSSYNTAKYFSLGGGLIIYCHRDDRTANGGGGMYKNNQGEDPVYDYRYTYRDWVERDSAPAIRAFAKTVKAINQPLANAVVNREFVEFNAEKADTFTATKTVGDMNITYAAENNGLGMAFKADKGGYIITATNTADFTFDTTAQFTAQTGYYDGEDWISTAEAVTVTDNTVTLTAGQIVRVDFNMYYEFMGEQVAFDVPDGAEIAVADDLNGKMVIKNTTAERKTFTLAEDLQDFKISYKFKNGSGWGSSGVLAPVLVKMRGSYQFANTYYNPNGDLYFGGGGETGRHKVAGSTTGWHTAEIMMKDNRMVIMYDGIVWDSRTLTKGTTSGALEISMRYIGTEITDLKVETVTDEDLNSIVNAGFSTNSNTTFPVTGAYNADEGALEITDQWNEYKLDGPNGFDDMNYAVAENYVLEMEFKLEGITTSAYQRGIEIHLPSGYSVGLFGKEFRTAERKYLTGYGNTYFTNRATDLMDGNYHTLKVVSKYGREQIIADGILLKSYKITDRVSGNISWKNNKQEGSAYLKSIKITEITDSADRVVYAEKEVSVADKNSHNRIITRAQGTVINENAWVFSTSFCIDDVSAYAGNALVWIRLKTTDSDNTNAVVVSIDKTQYYLQGSGYGIKSITDANGFVPHNIESGKQVDVRVMIIGNYIILTVDGKTDIWYAESGIPVDSLTTDHIQLFSGYEDNITFGDVKYEYADEVSDIIAAVDAIGEVTDQSSPLIFAAEDSFDILNDADLTELSYFTDKLTATYNEYDALFADGDVTENGAVDIIDLIRVKKIAAGSADKTIKANVDKDTDRNIDALDSVQLKKILLGVTK